MAINPSEEYSTKAAAAALNVSEEFTITWRDRALKQGLVTELGKKGSGLLLGRDYITICRKFWAQYEDAVHWHAFARVRAREQGLPFEEDED